MRDVDVAATRLLGDVDLELIARHDPDMIRDVAAALIARQSAETRLASLVEAVTAACDNLDALDSETKDRSSGVFAIKIGRSLSQALAEAESPRTEPPLSDGGGEL